MAKQGNFVHGKPCIHGHGTLRLAGSRHCAECNRIRARERYKRGFTEEQLKIQREKGKLHMRERRKDAAFRLKSRNDSRIRNWQRQGIKITQEEYDNLFESQKGLCAICSQPATERKRLGVDHNHDTGEIRELLCDDCNVGVGRFKENVILLELAIRYVKKWRLPFIV